jgi:hypothetical protein
MRTHRALLSVGFSLLLAAAAGAQEHRPLSPRGAASIQVGGKWEPRGEEMTYTGGQWIDVDYGRPILRGRKDIFGSGAEYGKAVDAGAPVWRVGANQTTRLHTDVPLTIGGNQLSAGDYSLFVDLAGGKWTLIVSRQPFQQKYDPKDKAGTWGAYNYDPKQDVFRVPMEVTQTPESVEQFTIAFLDATDKGGKLAMSWEHTRATVDYGLAP